MQDTSYDLYLVVRNGVTTMPATITTLSNKAKQPKGGYLPVNYLKKYITILNMNFSLMKMYQNH